MGHRRGYLHAARLGCDPGNEVRHHRSLGDARKRIGRQHRHAGAGKRTALRFLGRETLQRHHARDQARLEVLHAVCVCKVARQAHIGAFYKPRPEAEVAALERGVLRPAPALPQLFAARLVELRRIAVLQELPIALDFLQGVLLSRRETRQHRRQHSGQNAVDAHRFPPPLTQPPTMVASSVLLSPLLSAQLIATLSPGFPPLKRKCRNGLRETDVPHCAESTVLPPCVTVTLRMKCAGMILPCASLRSPVSMSCDISTFTSTFSPVMLARMRIGSAISTPTSPDGDLDLLHRVQVLAVRDHERVDVRGLRHLDARSEESRVGKECRSRWSPYH